ncbi:phage protease [Pseudovibrio sp. Tun.PSC04-5.I4]|uniref:phage protease n=1 Tax=Pseudovibrio sp. Tun.PSC04-5.I4 TaxID=1798213 RepID=UPI0008859638|nr:phage protease [Pseudovibrio sp. Tun.PSC04-5.I4]SDR07731.1 Mu-like prophage I protein [Pseudovibrio sp. Tun.PSC04-5.I4]
MNKNPHLTSTSHEIQLDGNAAVPAWIELVPAGHVVGRDGRPFVNDRPEDVVAFFTRSELDLVIDYEHATEKENVEGVPAAGWIKQLEVRDGAIWGRVEWTPPAAKRISNREFRFISPVLWHSLATKRVLGLASAALTHKPNLKMTALNSAHLSPPEKIDRKTEGTVAMKDEQRKALWQKLGLADEASDASILGAVVDLQGDVTKAQNSAQTPDPGKFVPVDTFNLMKGRAEKAENTSAEALKGDIEKAVNTAVEAGKIAPGSKEFYLKSCNNQDDLESFNKLIAGSAPAAVITLSDLDKADPDKGKAALSQDEKAVAKQIGLTDEEFLKQRG